MNVAATWLICSLIALASVAQPPAPPATRYGAIQRLADFPSRWVSPRNVDVWLPPGYPDAGRYAVLYMHDGQMLYDRATTWNHQSWAVDSTLAKLMRENKIRNCIVVGIWNDGKNRHAEYFPEKVYSNLPAAARQALAPLLPSGPLADNYLRFIVTELKPFIDMHFATLQDQQNTFIAGSSMGGLISMYAICEYPRIFSGAACLSTHWTGTFTANDNPIPAAMLQYLAAHLPTPKDHRLYFDHGTATLDSLYGPFQVTADSLIRAKGYGAPQFLTKVFAGANHSEDAWRQRFNDPAIFLLAPAPKGNNRPNLP
jgi:enterochelin esterase-like enzyme